jgi:hypothetical protein
VAPDDARTTRVALALLAVGVAGQTVVHLLNYGFVHSLRLNVNSEHTPFSATQALVIAAAAVGAVLAARSGGSLRPARGWVLGLLLAFLAVDEYFVVHEQIGVGTTQLLGLSDDWDSVVWPIVYLPLLAAVLVLLVDASRHSPRVPGRLLLLGIACLGAAVVLEIASAPFSTAESAGGVVHAVEGAFEEAAELGGWGMIAIGLLAGPRRR